MSNLHRRRRPSVRSAVLCLVVATVPLAAVACKDDAGPAVKLSAQGAAGKTVAQKFNCQSCHSIDGEELTGPTWKDLYGRKVTLTTGSTVSVDADYLERAVREPNAERRKDATGQMPTFDTDRISDAELDDLIVYLKELSTPASK